MFNNENNLTVCKLTDAYKFEFARGEGELLLANSRRGQEGRRMKAFSLPKGPKGRQPLKHKRDCLQKRLLEKEIHAAENSLNL